MTDAADPVEILLSAAADFRDAAEEVEETELDLLIGGDGGRFAANGAKPEVVGADVAANPALTNGDVETAEPDFPNADDEDLGRMGFASSAIKTS